jgi:N-acyl-D-aspartate/D-glutamate deacylase
MHDLVIRGGTIVDGTGRKAYAGDLAVDGGRIASVGGRAGPGRREIAAEGQLVSPGWVDIHTHYDGQVSWDPYLTPSSWHGVTTIVMGNCGVGFAPVRRGEESFLIRIMDGVEDIPGAALAAGIDFRWETFAEYLDALDALPRVLDVGTQVPHCAVRAYVMGERCHDDIATPEEIEEMARVTREGVRAGALGFSTSRTILHRERNGPLVPGTYCRPEELLALAGTLGEVGHGVFEMVSDRQGREPDRSWMIEFARKTGRPLIFALAQSDRDPQGFREVLEDLQRLNLEGLAIKAMVPGRPVGLLHGLQSSLHPFLTHPSFQPLRERPLAEQVRELRRPEVRAALLREEPGTENPIARMFLTNWSKYFALGDPPDYEPTAEQSAEAIAKRQGRSPAEVTLDWLLEREGRQLIYMPLANYAGYDLEVVRECLEHPSTVISLSDGGAHVGIVCDASTPTYMLTHWARDRTRGPRLGVERAVQLQTSETARLYGLHDRGELLPGRKADLNVIDHQRLRLRAPEMVFDLPCDGKRLVQRAEGYTATIVSGEVTFEHGVATGALPGRLVRGPQRSAL